MAAAALLGSMARKLARAPPPPPRPLLARGLHGGARSGPGGCLPPPASNQSGDRLVSGTAATAGLRSGAALPSLATKIARAPLQPHHRRILNRGYSSNTAPPIGDKDKIIEELRLRLYWARAAAGIGAFGLTGIAIYKHFWLLPEVEKEKRRLRVMNMLKPEDEHPSVSLAQVIARKGNMKQQPENQTENRTMADKLEEDMMAVCSDILKEIRADLKEFRASTARMSKSAPSEQKEGCSCSQVGSEAVTC